MQTFAERLPFASHFSIRTKINITIGLIFIMVVGSVTIYSGARQKDQTLALAEQQVKDMSTLYFDSLFFGKTLAELALYRGTTHHARFNDDGSPQHLFPQKGTQKQIQTFHAAIDPLYTIG